VRVWPCGVALTEGGTLIDLVSKRSIGTLASRDGEVIKTDNGWLIADWIAAFRATPLSTIETLVRADLPLTQKARQFFRYENRLFLVTESEIIELKLMLVGRPILGLGARTSVLAPRATKWFEGVGVQEALGATFMVLPFGERACGPFVLLSSMGSCARRQSRQPLCFRSDAR